MTTWRRISDWKWDLQLVSLADVPPQLIAEQRWVVPADAMATAWPRLSALAAEVKLARVSPEVAKLLQARGITLHAFGYHRGSDGWFYVRTGSHPVRYSGENVDFLPDTLKDNDDDDAFDQFCDSVVDAILRAASDGVLSERTVLIANDAAPLGPGGPVVDEGERAEHERLGADGLPPPADPELVEHVWTRLHAPPAPRPPLSPGVAMAARLAGAAGVVALGVAFLLRERAPESAVVALTLGLFGVLCLFARAPRR